MDEQELISKKQTIRARVLNTLYSLTNGSQSKAENYSKLADETGFSSEDVKDAFQYLSKAGFVEGMHGGNYRLTHKGILEVEKSIQN